MVGRPTPEFISVATERGLGFAADHYADGWRRLDHIDATVELLEILDHPTGNIAKHGSLIYTQTDLLHG